MTASPSRKAGVSLGSLRSAGPVWAIAMLVLVAAVRPLKAQTYTILHSFGNGTDGANPGGGLCSLATGEHSSRTFGTTLSGGAYGLGTVYNLGSSETVIFSFDGTDGRTPGSCPRAYDVTTYGGPNNGGTIFGLDAETQVVTPALYDFCSASDCT